MPPPLTRTVATLRKITNNNTHSEFRSDVTRLRKNSHVSVATGLQKENIESILQNVRRITQYLEGAIGEGKRYPSHFIFGSPPAPPELDGEEGE